MRTLESLKKEAKRWQSALERGDPEAIVRLEAALGRALTAPTLRDVQFALARELGFAGWHAVKDDVERTEAARRAEHGAPTYALYDSMASALFDAYRTGSPEAMARHYRFTWHRRPWRAMREYVQLDLGKRPALPGSEVEITLDDARDLVAIEHDFSDWEALRAATLHEPMARIRGPNGMTDEVVESLTRDPSVTRCDLAGMKGVTDAGLAALHDWPVFTTWYGGTAGMALLSYESEPNHLCLRGTLTDRGLALLRGLDGLFGLNIDAPSLAITAQGMAALTELPQLGWLPADAKDDRDGARLVPCGGTRGDLGALSRDVARADAEAGQRRPPPSAAPYSPGSAGAPLTTCVITPMLQHAP